MTNIPVFFGPFLLFLYCAARSIFSNADPVAMVLALHFHLVNLIGRLCIFLTIPVAFSCLSWLLHCPQPLAAGPYSLPGHAMLPTSPGNPFLDMLCSCGPLGIPFWMCHTPEGPCGAATRCSLLCLLLRTIILGSAQAPHPQSGLPAQPSSVPYSTVPGAQLVCDERLLSSRLPALGTEGLCLYFSSPCWDPRPSLVWWLTGSAELHSQLKKREWSGVQREPGPLESSPCGATQDMLNFPICRL